MIRIEPSREAKVGAVAVRRALPRRGRRTVGAWCFADHFGPATTPHDAGADGPGGIGPHPHIGLQTVTWLVEGELLHRDSLGSEQSIRPGQLNLMTAGHGIAHAEEARTPAGDVVHGIQLWVAQPDSTRDGAAAFEHHPELPRLELDNGTATVLVGELMGTRSPARADTDHHGSELLLGAGTTTLALRPEHEHAVVVLEGAATLDRPGRLGNPSQDGGQHGIGSEHIAPGQVALIDPGLDEVALTTSESTRAMLLGGSPFEWPVHMWWNFVGRDRDAIDAAYDDWRDGDDRFGDTGSPMDRIGVGAPPWRRG